MITVLNSAAMLRKFRTTAAMMQNADYDEDEIVRSVITHLHDGNNMSDLNRYCAETQVTRSNNGEFSDDGVILNRAISDLAGDLMQQFIQMRLYDSSCRLHYRLQSIVSSTIIVEPTS